MMMIMTNLKKFIFLAFFTSFCQCRRHHLALKDDDRKKIQMSTFGFQLKGYLEVNITFFKYMIPEGVKLTNAEKLFGFTLDKSGSSGISAYLENSQAKKCLLKNPAGLLSKEKKTNSLSIIFFKMDFEKNIITIERNGSDVRTLEITGSSSSSHSTAKRHVRKSSLSDEALKQRQRRDVAKPASATSTTVVPSSTKTTAASSTKTTAASSTKTTAASSTKTTAALSTKTTAASSTKTTAASSTKTTAALSTTSTVATKITKNNMMKNTEKIELIKVSKSVPMTKIKNKSMELEAYTMFFRVNINKKEEEGLYNLYFHNCPAYKTALTFDMTMQIIERNDGTYLSAGEIPLAPLYFTLFVLYLVAGCIWMSVLKKADDDVYKLHYLMFAVVIVKSFSCMFHAVNIYYIGLEGIHEEAWAVLYYIVYLTKGSLMIITIILVGAGWAFVKHILSDKEKKLFLIIIPLQVFDNIAYIIVEESEEGQLEYNLWKKIFIFIDLVCCGAILFPVVWSIKHLTEASNTDGKAAICLLKLKLFRQFYIMVVCYIYFTRIIVYLISITVPFQYEWLDQLFKELATVAFFVVTGYKFRPANDNPYLQVPVDSDEEVEMEEVVTQAGMYDGINRVNKKSDEGGTTPKQRESSHEYD